MVTILLVEDDKMVRLLTKAKLSAPYHILEAEDGKDALAVLDREQVDLLIVDIQMPRMNGYELIRELREVGVQMPVIMLTAMDTFAHKKEGFASGIDDYMTKPIDYEELVWRVEALLRRAKIANENKITIGKFSLNQKTFSAEYDGKTVQLTNKEFGLLFKLLSYPDVVFTKQQLMDEETTDRVFEKYYQGASGRSKGGNGIGLSIVKRIVTICDGEIAVRSAAGEGSTFTVTLKK
ncbi:MAG: hybrid sensor histidine kinase/response regulator [Fastidiosipilaceae bacterium]|jgi:two-component system OmpR family response regulator